MNCRRGTSNNARAGKSLDVTTQGDKVTYSQGECGMIQVAPIQAGLCLYVYRVSLSCSNISITKRKATKPELTCYIAF